MKCLSLQKRMSKLTTKKFSRIGSRGQCYKTILQKTIVVIIVVIISVWKELMKCLVDDSSNVWSADLSQRHKSDDFNSFLMHLFF